MLIKGAQSCIILKKQTHFSGGQCLLIHFRTSSLSFFSTFSFWTFFSCIFLSCYISPCIFLCSFVLSSCPCLGTFLAFVVPSFYRCSSFPFSGPHYSYLRVQNQYPYYWFQWYWLVMKVVVVVFFFSLVLLSLCSLSQTHFFLLYQIDLWNYYINILGNFEDALLTFDEVSYVNQRNESCQTFQRQVLIAYNTFMISTYFWSFPISFPIASCPVVLFSLFLLHKMWYDLILLKTKILFRKCLFVLQRKN